MILNHPIEQWIALGLGVHGLAVAVVNLTPTPKDNEALAGFDKAWAKAYRAIELLAGIVTPLVKR